MTYVWQTYINNCRLWLMYLKKEFTYDIFWNILKNFIRMELSSLLELEENSKELQELQKRLKEIGESLWNRKITG